MIRTKEALAQFRAALEDAAVEQVVEVSRKRGTLIRFLIDGQWNMEFFGPTGVRERNMKNRIAKVRRLAREARS